jgi:hypothetical protein
MVLLRVSSWRRRAAVIRFAVLSVLIDCLGMGQLVVVGEGGDDVLEIVQDLVCELASCLVLAQVP